MFSMALHCSAVRSECQTGQAYSRTGLISSVEMQQVPKWNAGSLQLLQEVDTSRCDVGLYTVVQKMRKCFSSKSSMLYKIRGTRKQISPLLGLLPFRRYLGVENHCSVIAVLQKFSDNL